MRVLDNRVFHEVLNDALHNRNKKHIGKFMTDERFDRIVRACGYHLSIKAKEKQLHIISMLQGRMEGYLHGKQVMKNLTLQQQHGPPTCMKLYDFHKFTMSLHVSMLA